MNYRATFRKASLLVALLSALALADEPAETSADAPSEEPAAAAAPLRSVPLVPQSNDYSCGAASLAAVLAYYGVDDWYESQLQQLLSTSPEGTAADEMARFANEHGLKASVKQGATLAELDAAIAKANPVIVAIQAWRKESDLPYPDLWTSGHYVVYLGREGGELLFMDPVLLGHRGALSEAEMLERWHDTIAGGEKIQHLAIFFEGTPSPPGSHERIP